VRVRQQTPARPPVAEEAPVPAADPARLAALHGRLGTVEGPLRDALAELGRLVLARS
jgi:hypothetical protein